MKSNFIRILTLSGDGEGLSFQKIILYVLLNKRSDKKSKTKICF